MLGRRALSSGSVGGNRDFFIWAVVIATVLKMSPQIANALALAINALNDLRVSPSPADSKKVALTAVSEEGLSPTILQELTNNG